MAIDTRNKRASAVLYKLPFGRVFPNPDGSLSSGVDRAHILSEYSGISPASLSLSGGKWSRDDLGPRSVIDGLIMS